MEHLNNLITGAISHTVASNESVGVVIYFPTDEERFKKSLSLFETLCRSLHFPNYSYLEMKGNADRLAVKTHFYLFNEKWSALSEKGKPEDLRKAVKNFDGRTMAFRNYDFLDFECEAMYGGQEQAQQFLADLKREGTYALGYIEAREIEAGVPKEKELLRALWSNDSIFASLTQEETEELKCRLEHQHWCADKLLKGFRELDATEMQDFGEFRLPARLPISESDRWGMHKRMYDRKRLYASMKKPAHLDLCSFDELMLRDFSTVHFDREHFDQIVAAPIPDTPKQRKTNPRGSVCQRLEKWRSLRQERFDRFLANFNKFSLLKVVAFIFSIPLVLAGVAWLLSVTNTDMFSHNGLDENVQPCLWWGFLYQFMDPGNQHMVGTSLGLGWALVVALLGMFFLNGFLISSVVNYIERHVQNWREGKARYHFRNANHIVIIGGHEMIIGILNQIDRPEVDRFVIMTEQDISEYREYLCSHVNKEIADKIVFYRGDRTSRKDIESLYLNDTSLLSVYVIGEGTSSGPLEPNHDAKNMTCSDLIAHGRDASAKRKLRCYVMFEHRSSYVAFQQAELPEIFKARLLFEPFNIFEMCAQDLLVAPKAPIRPIDISRFSEDLLGEKNYIDMDSRRRVHLVIFGMSKIGMALASEAAILCHYPNYAKLQLLEDEGALQEQQRKEELRMRITFIDMDAEQQMKFYQNRMPSLFDISRWKYMDGRASENFTVVDKLTDNPLGFGFRNLVDDRKNPEGRNFLDVEWEFITGALGDRGVDQYLKSLVSLDREILTIAVCLPNGEEGLSLASTIPAEVSDKSEQIFVYQRQTDGIVRQMAGGYREVPFDQKVNRYGKLRPFGMYSTCFNQELLDNTLATKIFGKNYRKLKKAIKDHTPISSVQLEDLATQPILERWSAVYSAHNWSVKFRSMGMASGELPSKELLEREFNKDKGEDKVIRNTRAKIWGRVEHNRWSMERLIKIGEQPVSISDYDPTDTHEFKESFKKSAKRSHLDICSMSRLKTIDQEVIESDIDRNYRLVEIYDAIATQGR